jgi:hypothetical protein
LLRKHGLNPTSPYINPIDDAHWICGERERGRFQIDIARQFLKGGNPDLLTESEADAYVADAIAVYCPQYR